MISHGHIAGEGGSISRSSRNIWEKAKTISPMGENIKKRKFVARDHIVQLN